MTALEIAQKNAARVAELRRLMPGTAANLDEWREHFPDARMVHAIEGSRQYGYRAEDVRASEAGMPAEEFDRLKKRQRRAG